jgi:hypothetical protein
MLTDFLRFARVAEVWLLTDPFSLFFFLPLFDVRIVVMASLDGFSWQSHLKRFATALAASFAFTTALNPLKTLLHQIGFFSCSLLLSSAR